MHAAVIIPIHNGARFLRRCLQAILGQQYDSFEVVAIENGSSDGSAALIAGEFPQVRLVEQTSALGFPAAVNLGIQTALQLPRTPSFVVVLNQDTEVDPGWLAALSRQFERRDQLGIIGSRARFPDGQIQHAGAELTLPRWYGRNLAAEAERGSGRPFISFLGVALRTEMIRAVGLLDAGFGAGYYEDADYCLRAAAAGWDMAVAYEATLLHHEGAATAASYRHTALVERNRFRLALKHAPVSELLGPFLDAERAAVAVRSNAGDSQGLRQAYLRALIDLPQLGAARGLSQAEQQTLATALGKLRDLATSRERASRMFGLAVRPRTHDPGPRAQEPRTKNQEPQNRRTVDSGTKEQKNKRTKSNPQLKAELEYGTMELQDLTPQHSSFVHRPSSEPTGHLPPAAREDTPSSIVLRPSSQTTSHQLPPVSIIMLTWNGLSVTQACLESVRRLTEGVVYQVIVVDNGSTDETPEWLREQPDIVLIENTTNLGFTRGNNQGMAAAPAGSDILLLNNDTLITQNTWLARLREVAHSDPSNGVVGCTLLHGNGMLQHAGTYMPDELWGYQIGGGEPYVGQYPGVRKVEGITGACMYIRRDVYEAIGGFDPAYFSYFEDTDYCLRASQAGYHVICVGDVQVTHLENTSTKVNRSDWQAMFSAGRQTFVQRWRDHYAARYTRSLLWHSLLAAPTGYATSSREFVRELDRRSVDVRTACIFGTDYTEPKTRDPRIDQMLSRPKDLSFPQVVYSQADAFVKNSGRYKIGFTMHETDRLPEDWVRQANQMDEIWTPTHWGAEVFRASGVTRPIYTIPLGVDPNYFHPDIVGRKPTNRFVFLSVFDWIERKGPDVLLRAYQRAFTPADDVLLILKVFNTDPFFDIQRHVADIAQGPMPQITILLNQRIAPAQFGVLYRSADCFVLPTRGEGWGMPALEAMASGLPVISTGWGAQSEFLNEDVGYPIRLQGMSPAVTRSPYYAGTQWAEPDLDHLTELMRYVYENPEQAQATGHRAAQAVQEQWTWAHATEKIITRLDAIIG